MTEEIYFHAGWKDWDEKWHYSSRKFKTFDDAEKFLDRKDYCECKISLRWRK